MYKLLEGGIKFQSTLPRRERRVYYSKLGYGY